MLPKLFGPIVRKNCFSDQENFLKFEAEGQEFGKFTAITITIYSNSERPEQFLATESFSTCSWIFIKSDKSEQLEFKLQKLLWFRNMQEKLEKVCTYSDGRLEFFFLPILNVGRWLTGTNCNYLQCCLNFPALFPPSSTSALDDPVFLINIILHEYHSFIFR